MRALQLQPDGSVALAEAHAPRPAPDGVLIRPALAVLTTDDRQAAAQPAAGAPGTPLTLGHACVGTLADDPGTRVVAEPVLACGTCAACAGGAPTLCLDARHLGGVQAGQRAAHGCFADALAVPLHNAVPVPADVPDDAAVLAAPVAAALQARRRAAAEPGDFATVIGAGAQAALTAHLLHHDNPATRLLSDDAATRRWCEQHGIRTRAPGDVMAAADQAAVVVCAAAGAAGDPAAVSSALAAAAPRGTVVLSGPVRAAVPAAAVTARELAVVGASRAPLAEALALLRPGAGLDFTSLTARPVDPDRAPALFAAPAAFRLPLLRFT